MEIEKCLLLTILQIFPHCWEWLCKKGQKNSWHKHNIGQIVYYCSNTHLSEGQQQKKNVSSLSYQFNCCCIWFSRRFLKVTVYFWELRSENKHCNASSPVSHLILKKRKMQNFYQKSITQFHGQKWCLHPKIPAYLWRKLFKNPLPKDIRGQTVKTALWWCFSKQQVFKNPPTPSAAPSITIVIPARSEFS